MKTETTNEPFAIVPQELIADPRLDPSAKIILMHCLGKYQTKLENGMPWTFSCPSIAGGTGLPDRTVRYHVSKLKKEKVLRPWGTMTSLNGKRRYEVYLFSPADLDALLSAPRTAAMVAVENPDKSGGDLDSWPASAANSAATSAAKRTDRNKIVEERQYKEKGSTNNTGVLPAVETLSLPSTATAPIDLGEQFEKFFHAP